MTLNYEGKRFVNLFFLFLFLFLLYYTNYKIQYRIQVFESKVKNGEETSTRPRGLYQIRFPRKIQEWLIRWYFNYG